MTINYWEIMSTTRGLSLLWEKNLIEKVKVRDFWVLKLDLLLMLVELWVIAIHKSKTKEFIAHYLKKIIINLYQGWVIKHKFLILTEPKYMI